MSTITITLEKREAEVLLSVVVRTISEAHEYLMHPALDEQWLAPVKQRKAHLERVADSLAEALALASSS